jgi:hypothetical protein
MKRLNSFVAFAMALMVLAPASLFASSHREAPISALDHSADVTDWYAFVSYDHPDRVTMILNVDGFLEPSIPACRSCRVSAGRVPPRRIPSASR